MVRVVWCGVGKGNEGQEGRKGERMEERRLRRKGQDGRGNQRRGGVGKLGIILRQDGRRYNTCEADIRKVVRLISNPSK